MKSIIIRSIVLLFLSSVIFSFNYKPGGEGFEIYLNNKIVLQQYGNEMNTVKSFRLHQSSQNEKLSIKYFHCGKVGLNRTITFKNGNDKVLKVYSYNDASTPSAMMNLDVKEIFNIKNGNGNTLKLYYASSELKKGRMLATVLISDVAK